MRCRSGGGGCQGGRRGERGVRHEVRSDAGVVDIVESEGGVGKGWSRRKIVMRCGEFGFTSHGGARSAALQGDISRVLVVAGDTIRPRYDWNGYRRYRTREWGFMKE